MDTLSPSQITLSLTNTARSSKAHFQARLPSDKKHSLSQQSTYAVLTTTTSPQNSPHFSPHKPQASPQFSLVKHLYAYTFRGENILLSYLTSDPNLDPKRLAEKTDLKDPLQAIQQLTKNPAIKSMALACLHSPQSWIYSRWPDGPAFYWKQKATPLLSLEEFCAGQNLRSLALYFKEPITPSFSAMASLLWQGYPNQDTSLTEEFARLPLGEILHVDLEKQTLRMRPVDSPAKIRDYLHLEGSEKTNQKTTHMETLRSLGIEQIDLCELFSEIQTKSTPFDSEQLLQRIAFGEIHLCPFYSHRCRPSHQHAGLARIMQLPRTLTLEQSKQIKKILASLWKQGPLEKQLTSLLFSSALPQKSKKWLGKTLAKWRHRHLNALFQKKGLIPPPLKKILSHLNSYYDPAWNIMKVLTTSCSQEDFSLIDLHSALLWNIAPTFAAALPEALCSSPVFMPYIASEYLRFLKAPSLENGKSLEKTLGQHLFPQKSSLQNEGFLPKTLLRADPELFSLLMALEKWCQHHVDATLNELFELKE